MFPWKSVITFDKGLTKSIYLQVAEKIIREINLGRLHTGQKMPGTRQLSELLGLNRKTIILAYEELEAQGWLEAKLSSGTYISNHLPVVHSSQIGFDDNSANLLTDITAYPTDFIPEFETIPSNSKRIDGGSPDHRLAPIDWFYKECRSLSKSNYGNKLLSYAGVQGDPKLREILALYLSKTRGMKISEQNILITKGSQMGIFVALSGLVKKNDQVVVGNSSYDAADWTIQYCGGTINRISVDDEGIDTEQLENLCQQKKIKLIYITPHHHFPTTVTLSNRRRIHLLQLSLKYKFSILEDDYDYDFHYSGSPILPLASLNPSNRVIYIGSFSKIFAPNMRIGYLAANKELIDAFCKIRRIIDRQGDHIMQRVLAEAIKSGELSRHLKKSIQVYRKRRDNMVQLLNEHLNQHVEFKIPEGGMAIWVKFKKISVFELHPILIKMNLHMDIDPELGQKFNALRMGFASVDENEQENAIRLVAKAIKQLAS